ncbi:MAG: hypothetical protein IKK24_05055, partial [Clostridia bacterium]|nr:hypothetical protein [Clostridia bacterium]
WEIGGDRYAKVKKGETVEFKVKKTEFNCNSMEEFYEKVLNTRYSSGRKTQQMGLPLNEAFNTIKDKFNVHNWIEKIGVYRTYPNSDEMVFSAGWCGGGFVPYIFRHLNENTDSESINRAKRYMDYIYSNTQTSSGLFQCCMDEDGNVMGDDFYDRNNIYIHLIRRSADILYYHAALFNYMKKNNSPIPEKWHNGLRKCADAFLKLWNENKDLGFLVNNETLEIVAGGSHSGSMAIAGLALASVYYENNDYLTAAKEIADKYYERFINQGYTTGGPAEAMTAPDSESAYALLEGLVTVYEITENDKYLKFAEYTAAYVSTWVIDYDYHYPKTCLFGKTDKKTTGAVWANLQNKHGAPGFATHSGSAYLRLYIYTGKEIYLNIIADVARAITQFTAHPDNRLFDYLGVELPSGFMCERVNTCDWEDFVFIGSLFYGSNWCEYSAMMCYTDLPGIVWDKTKNTVTLLDRMEAVIENGRLKITNPTKYDCTVKVLVLNGEKEVLSCELNDKFTAVSVASGQSVII